MIVCVYCGGDVPVPERRGDETWCVSCGKAYREDASLAEDVWYAQRWEKYVPVES